MEQTYSFWRPRLARPLAALGLLLATAGTTHAQRGAPVNSTAPHGDASRPPAQAWPRPATTTTYQPVGTTAQARQQTQATAAFTTTVTFANTQQGWFSPQTGHDASNANYIAGTLTSNSKRLFRNFFTFSLASLNLTGKQVVGATLSLVNGQTTAIPNSTVTYSLYDVSTPAATLGTTYAGGDPVVTSVFNDLGTGKSYGNFVNTAASTGRRVYTLAAPALADIAARAGQTFSVGGMLLEEQATTDAFLFGATGSTSGSDGVGQQILTLELLDAQTIATGAVSAAVCAGAALSVPFTAAGTFAAGNVFTAQLSDAAGSFAAPVAIGTLASTSSGTIAATVPAATAGGNGYRVRVVSSSPSITGTDNGSAVSITGLPTLASLSATSGPVGTQVTIMGTNLTGATAVRFGNTAASSFAVNSATSLTATVPAGATSGNVTVTTPCGTSGGVQFTVTANAPVLAAIETSVLPYNSSQAPAQITSALTVRDADSPNLTGATVAISSGLTFGDRLNFINQNGISGTYTFNTGVLVLNGSAPVATYQAALRSITFATLGNSAGVAGDRVVSFSVSDGTNASNQVARTIRVVGQPAVATVPPSGLTSTSAVLGGNVSADGGDAVTDRGVVYSLATNSASPNISIGLAGVTQDRNGTGLGSYSKTIAGLAPGTSYYARAYATNTAGTSYGTPLGFTTAAAVSGTAAVTNVSCYAGSNGAIDLTPTGGVAPYTYRWSDGPTTQDRTNLPAGSYSVTITDAAGATGTVSNIIVSQPTSLTASASQTNIACNGGSEGVTAVSASGGTGPYTYRWSTGATTPAITGLTAGSYSVSITDANGCMTSRTIVIVQPSALTATTSQTNVTTTGGNNGSATITVSGGSPNYTYSWSPNVSTTATAPNLSAGTYTVTVTDAKGCTITRTFNISQPAPTTTVVSISSLSRSPTNTAQVAYQVVFGTSVSGVSAGNFSVTPTGSVSGAAVSSVSGSGTTYTVVVNTGTGDGTLRLDVTNAAGLSIGLTNLPFAGTVYTIDKTPPTLVITSATAPDGGYTTTSPLVFLLTFSEPVTTPVVALTNASLGTSFPINASTYSISAIPTNPGAVTITLAANQSPDRAGNYPLMPPTYTIYYNVPTAAPVLTSPANNSTTATTTPTYQGTAPAGSTVTVFVDGLRIGATTATTGGTFNLVQPTALTQGSHTVYATAQLSGQLASANSNTNTFTVASAPAITAFSPVSGPVGTQVTITGTNLSGATAVSFNGTAASSFVVNSATSITAVVAAGTTTGLVRVSTPGGVATSATSFVVRVAPTTVADSYSTPQGVTLTGNVLTNDIGTNPRAILINRPANGSLVLNPNGSFTYVPNAGFTGTDTFTYYACDPDLPLLCGNPATVSISVLRIAPVTVADSYTTPAGTTLTGNVLTNDLGTNPRAILITRTSNGTLVLNPNGSFTYVPNAGFVGTDTFTYYACDPNLPLLCGNPATVTITVTRVAPVTVADRYSTPQGVTLTGNVLTNDLGTNPRAILINRPTRGTLVLNPDGSFTYVPNAGFVGTDSFTYYACNQGTPLVCGDPATVSIIVTPASTAARPAAQSATAAQPATPATGGAAIALELALTGHPNPFSDELQLSFSLPIAQAYTLAVYDAQGRLVQQLARGQAEAGQAQELAVPTHTYAAGLYLVRLTTPTGTRQLKLIKQ